MSSRRRRPAPSRAHKGRKGKKATKMPACTYGAACTRKGCIYSHPPKKRSAGGGGAAPSSPESDDVCLPYVAGLCTYGSRCRKRHPSQAQCAVLRASYAEQPCRWGDGCRSEGCLYWHSWNPLPAAATAAPFVPSIAAAPFRPSVQEGLA